MAKDERQARVVEREKEKEDLFDLVSARAPAGQRLDGVSIGRLCGFDSSGAPLVDFPENASRVPIAARTTILPELDDVGREVALLFENGDALRPILVGCLLERRPVLEIEPATSSGEAHPSGVRESELDGERLIFTAKQEIVLRCGNASITLTKGGKVLIRGEYVLSRSSGVNRIKGGSVQIN
jgi:hypothetical protein